MQNLIDRLRELVEENGGAISITVASHTPGADARTEFMLHGAVGLKLAKQAGALPGPWYGFESVYKGQDSGRPQRAYSWTVDGVGFTALENIEELGITIAEARAQNTIEGHAAR
jgi:hypothetical protein